MTDEKKRDLEIVENEFAKAAAEFFLLAMVGEMPATAVADTMKRQGASEAFSLKVASAFSGQVAVYKEKASALQPKAEALEKEYKDLKKADDAS